jgi:hypothetical protein
MRMVAKSNKQLVLIFAIFLAVFSTGVVIVHQCQSMSSSQVAMQHQHVDADSVSSIATKPMNGASDRQRLINSGCAALFMVVLLFGRKLLGSKTPRSGLNRLLGLSREFVSIHRPQVFHFALSLPQLGVIRI